MLTEDEHNAAIGQKIRFYRTLAGMSQEALGKVLEVSYQQIQKYELGVNAVSSAKLARVAITLNVPADVLLGINQDATQEYALDRLTGRILHAVASQTDKQKRALLEVVEAFA